MNVNCTDAVRSNYQDLYRFVYRMAGNRETAEDVVQEAFLRLSRENPNLPNETAVRRWLFVVARNLCISNFRQNSRLQATSIDNTYGIESKRGSPSDSILKSERDHAVRQAVQSLPPLLREALILREFENMSYLDIAAVTGCPMGTVRSRLAKARDFLKEKLQSYMETR